MTMAMSVTTVAALDVNETGRVLAQLDDWRAIVFVLVFIIVVLLVERLWSQREMRLERKEMRELARSFSDSATKVADALASLRLEVGVLRIMASRMESTAGLEYFKIIPDQETTND